METTKPRTGLVIWMVLCLVLTAASLMFWFMAAAFGSMPPFAALLWLYPILPLGLLISSWSAFKKHRNGLAATLSGIAFAPPLLFFLVINLGLIG